MKQINEIIKEKRMALGLTMKELSMRVGVSEGTISRWESGEIKNMRRSAISSLAEALHISPSIIMGWRDENGKEAPGFDPATLPDYVPIAKKKIPLIGTIAAGEPIIADEHIEEWLPVDDDIRADFALRVAGDSMINADIEDGDIVFIRQQDVVDDGQIAAVLIDDSATLKRFYRIPGGVQLVAENPKYRPMFFNESNCDTFRIIGLAVAKLSYFKY